jgi:hypothetical protein
LGSAYKWHLHREISLENTLVLLTRTKEGNPCFGLIVGA